MKTIETVVYTANELKSQFPDGWENALRKWQNSPHEIFWQDEIVASFKAVFKEAGMNLKNWSIGGRGTDCKFSFYDDAVCNFSGARAMAWLENNLFGALRLKQTDLKAHASCRSCGDCRPYCFGMVPPCPLTGYCADDDFLDSIRESVRKGMTLKDSFRHLAEVAAKLLEDEESHQNSEEYFLEDCEANGVQFTEDGEKF